MSDTTSSVSFWHKLGDGVLRTFRGLVYEKKDGAWEISQGRTAFWVVFFHCMHVWNSGVKAAAKAAIDTATATDQLPAAVESVSNAISMVSIGNNVPEQEFYLLMALIGYSALKTTKGGVTNMVSAIRGDK
jgi:hypothetical protein